MDIALLGTLIKKDLYIFLFKHPNTWSRGKSTIHDILSLMFKNKNGENVISTTLIMAWALKPTKVFKKLLLSECSHTSVFGVWTEWWRKITFSERQQCGKKLPVNERGHRRIARPVQTDRKAMVTEIITLYSCDEQESTLEWTKCQVLSIARKSIVFFTHYS